MFCIGDKVAHPMHGGGVITDIVREKVAGSISKMFIKISEKSRKHSK